VTAGDDDGMTLGEIGRRLLDLVAEVRGLRAEVVRRDVYGADRRADDRRLSAVEARQTRDEADRAALRRLVYAALLSTAGSVAVAILGLALKR
jgi:hypothetical protein